MHIAFRADASLQIGTGHVMRCLTLADALRERGAHCTFVCRPHQGHLLALIAQRGHLGLGLPELQEGAKPNRNGTAHAHWLGADWTTDAQNTQQALSAHQGGQPVDWLVVDHYALDVRWEEALCQQAKRIMVIDDLADRPHACDLLLDQNWYGDKNDSRYDHLIPPPTNRLLGPRYALLNTAYSQLRALLPQRDGIVRRVLVFMGGSDPTNQTATVIKAMMVPNLQELALDVVIGVNHPDPTSIAVLVGERPHTVLHRNLPNLAGLMARADLMVGAGGSTTWERMSLGLPSLVIGVADNQLPTNQALHSGGYVHFLGHMKEVTISQIVAAVRQALDFPELLKQQSQLMQQLVPATGVAFVCSLILAKG
ncbi:UDP-2,4-diacetamido-2,4,6-trideoxy-beta-L-altropyranose hydrolase [Rhodoferax bucti]|uniref:UDP-2,4-diacetamido-2,4, 6-trideoxy-beta-L-altropyranose hydrolase n=1 Tax=Rhodoferax bucti TaxID=2576305 RepID=UPI001109FBAA|nr:UDP-2,4-diacetamido-2,4,6-trideoxy-beta-L-altropyranose hydrolase [Rhodoferax bucti]